VSLRDEQIDLYSRQIILRELGGVGQRRLLEARCLLVGAGSAIEFAASYLAGAGIGRLDRLATERSRTALAPLADRNPDVELRMLEPGSAIDLGAYDAAVLDLGAVTSSRIGGGRATIGEVGIGASSDGAREILVVPAAADACVACAAPAPDGRPVTPDAVLDAFAGAMSALVVLRWLAGIDADRAVRRLVLGSDSPTWRDEPVGARSPCTRPCRSGTQPLGS